MLEKLDLLVRFWELRARNETVDVPLADSERAELLSLLRLIKDESAMSDPAAIVAFAEGCLPIQMTAKSGFLAGDLRQLDADQLVVAASEVLAEDDRTIVYIADAVSGIEYALPCVVLFSHVDMPCIMGLAIDGIPVRSTFTIPVSGMLRSPLGLPTQPRASA